MLISASRCPIEGAGIEIPAWLRAPLYLSEGATYYTIVENRPLFPKYVELITTTIDRDHWGDMWRIEMETEDTPGDTALLTNLLTERGLLILHLESSVNAFSRSYMTTAIVSGRTYDSGRDLSHRERLRQKSCKLQALEEDILIYFWDAVTVDAEGAPRLKIRQVNAFRQLYDDVNASNRFLINKDGQPFDGGKLVLSSRAVLHLRKLLRSEQLGAWPAVDTKNRLLKTIVYRKDDPSAGQVQLIYPSNDQAPLNWVFGALHQGGASVVRSQIRPAPPSALAQYSTYRQAVTGDAHYFDEPYLKADIAFDLVPGARAVGDVGAFLDQVEGRFGEQSFAKDNSAFIRRRAW